jgi:tricorn protease
MLRFPAVSATHIAFCYANDLWLVPRAGGVATPLASPPGPETNPRFSPDGQAIAFVGNYEGGRDLYVLPVAGGIAARLTHHPGAEELCGWTPDGRLLFFSAGMADMPRQTALFTVSPAGGLPERMPVPYSGFAAVSPDGQWLAMTPYSIDNRTWKRYRGGMATDIWLFNLRDRTSKKVTDWEGTDTLPMWHGDDLYYHSDEGPQHRLNIWRYDTRTGRREQVTAFADDDVKWPSIGPGPEGRGEIVFQLGSQIRLLDLATRQVSTVDITIPGDRPTLRPRLVDAAANITRAALSPAGKRVVIEARGDLWSAPAREGATINLTRSDGAFDRDPAWSPDGQWIAHFSDRSGEYELWLVPADGRRGPDAARQLTTLGPGFRYNPVWSPDSKFIAFTDETGRLMIVPAEGGPVRTIDTDPWANQMACAWSPDSRWLAYARADEGNSHSCIWLWNAVTGDRTRVTDRMFDSEAPCFDRKGDFLYFRTTRSFERPLYGESDTSFIYAGTQVLAAIPLRADLKSPFAPRNDADQDKDKEKDRNKEKDQKKNGEKRDGDQPADPAKKDEKPAPADKGDAPADASPGASPPPKDESKPAPKSEPKEVKIDLDGLEARAFTLPVPPGVFGAIAVSDAGKVVYVRRPVRGMQGDPSIRIFDPADEKKEEKTVADGVGAFDLSADGKRLLLAKGRTLAVVDPAPGQDLSKPVPTSDLKARIDPRAEWRQIFNDAWRLQRDFFYEPTLHHVDWPAMREHYGRMLDDCASRQDVSYVIAEMISELNVGHAYVTAPGDIETEPTLSVGMLGCDFERVPGAGPDGRAVYRVARILGGAPWDLDARGPLAQPGLGVKVGDYLLAVNGAPVDADKDPYAAFLDLAGKTVTITVSDHPVLDERARDALVRPASTESDLRYRDWVERNRQHVFRASGGKVGYIHVPDTGINGQNELVRQFYGQRDMAALIIDDRWNGGGQIPTRFIELLNRPPTNYWARRHGNDWPWPPDAHFGPKCMLINGRAGSGGDAFPAYFRRAGLGKLIGLRTWGGLVGISGNPGLIDGGAITVPTFGYFELDGTWGIEGHGVDPDIEVYDDPALLAAGKDPQLDAAIEYMLQQLRERPYVRPPRPASPDRRGMGIPERDR